jgi:hypothetical protein
MSISEQAIMAMHVNIMNFDPFLSSPFVASIQLLINKQIPTHLSAFLAFLKNRPAGNFSGINVPSALQVTIVVETYHLSPNHN